MTRRRTKRKWVIKDGTEFDMRMITDASKEQQEEWLGEYREKLLKGSEEYVKEVEDGTIVREKEGETSNTVPYELQLDQVPYNPPSTGLDEELVIHVMKNINTMSLTEMRAHAKSLYLPISGQKKQLRARLRAVFRKEMANIRGKDSFQRGVRNKTLMHYDYLVVMDLECTCVEILRQYPHEVIELPAVLVNLQTMEIEDDFQTFVRPKLNPILDDFCIKLTGITQAQVDSAPYFTEAYAMFEGWMKSHKLGEGSTKRYAFVTDGPCDFHKFLQYQCQLVGMPIPHCMRYFINVKKIFEQKNGKLQRKGQKESSLKRMLDHYKLAFEGKAHSGLDDAVNIARLAMKMMQQDNIELKINMQIIKKVGSYVVPDPSKDRRVKEARAEGDEEAEDRALWDAILPYRLAPVSRTEFFSESFKECDSCEELREDSDTDEEGEIKRKREVAERQTEGGDDEGLDMLINFSRDRLGLSRDAYYAPDEDNEELEGPVWGGGPPSSAVTAPPRDNALFGLNDASETQSSIVVSAPLIRLPTVALVPQNREEGPICGNLIDF